MGNTPEVDLLCRSPQKTHFPIQVKSLSSKTSFLFSRGVGRDRDDLYYVLVLIPKRDSERPEYYILDGADTLKLQEMTRVGYEARQAERGKPPVAFPPGIGYSDLKKLDGDKHLYLDAWERVLPR